MAKKKNREINVFSTSAIDLFASSLGVFIVLVIILIPYFNRKAAVTTNNAGVQTSQLKQMVEMLESEVKIKSKDLESSKKDFELNLDQLKKQIKELETQKTSLQVNLIEKNKEKLEEQGRKKLLIDEKVKTNTSKIKSEKKLQILIASLKNKNQFQKRKIEIISNSKINLDKKLQRMQTDNLALQKALQGVNKKKKYSSFLAVIAQWKTTKHDLDLEIVDPKGRVFNYKSRKHRNSKALFSLDSRSGPGAEVWQTSEILKGTYKVKINFYNDYGNKTDAIVQTTLFTQKGTLQIPEFKLNLSSKRYFVRKFSVDADGKIRMQR